MNTTGSLGIDAQTIEADAAKAVSALTGVSADTVEHGVDHAIAEVDKKSTSLLEEFPHFHFDILQLAERAVTSSHETFHRAEDKVKAIIAAAEAFIKHLEEKTKLL